MQRLSGVQQRVETRPNGWTFSVSNYIQICPSFSLDHNWDADSDGTLMPDSLNEVPFASMATFFSNFSCMFLNPNHFFQFEL